VNPQGIHKEKILGKNGTSTKIGKMARKADLTIYIPLPLDNMH